MKRAYGDDMDGKRDTHNPNPTPLSLSSVLINSLPPELMTDDAPDRYTVEAVFTRRPEPAEVEEIHGEQTRDMLARVGYPKVTVTVSDRRLEIANTNLEELRGGLATAIAERLVEITAHVHEGREASVRRDRLAAKSERERAALVKALAEAVRFETRRRDGSPRCLSADTRSQEAQVDDWTDEGGQGHS